jgi:hypothetical protein
MLDPDPFQMNLLFRSGCVLICHRHFSFTAIHISLIHQEIPPDQSLGDSLTRNPTLLPPPPPTAKFYSHEDSLFSGGEVSKRFFV